VTLAIVPWGRAFLLFEALQNDSANDAKDEQERYDAKCPPFLLGRLEKHLLFEFRWNIVKPLSINTLCYELIS